MAAGSGTEWVAFMNEAVASGTPVTMADLRQRGYKGAPSGVQSVINGDHVNKDLGGELANTKSGPGSSSPFNMRPTKTQTIGGTVALDKIYGNSSPGGIHKILGMSNPSGGTNTNLFTVLSKHTCNISVLWACNRRSIMARVRVGLDVGGGGTNLPGDSDWIYYDLELPGNHTLTLDAATGLWLAKDDDVVVRTDVGGVSFGASGRLYGNA